MDAFAIAQLMASQDSKNPLKARYGTVSALNADSTLSVIPDGQTSPVSAVRCCHPHVGNRVMMLISDIEWLATSVIGGDSLPQDIADLESAWGSVSPSANSSGWTYRNIDGVKECWGLFSVAVTQADTVFRRTIGYPFAFASKPCVTITSCDGAGWLQSVHPPYNDSDAKDSCTIACSVRPNDYMPINLVFGVRAIGS